MQKRLIAQTTHKIEGIKYESTNYVIQKEKLFLFLKKRKRITYFLFQHSLFAVLFDSFWLLVLITHSLLIIEYYPFSSCVKIILYCVATTTKHTHAKTKHLCSSFLFFTLKRDLSFICFVFFMPSQLAVKGRDKIATSNPSHITIFISSF